MKITDKMKGYEPLVIPFSKPIEAMNENEAKQYNDWFVQNAELRANYLFDKVFSLNSEEKIGYIYTEKSLLEIWKWFLQNAEISKTPLRVLREIKKSMAKLPKSMIQHTVSQNKDELSVYTRYVLRDIGMYLGQMLISKFPSIKWSYKTKPKNYAYVNEALLVGFVDNNPDYPQPFYPELEPIGAVECIATNLFDGSQKDTDLLDMYRELLLWIPNR